MRRWLARDTLIRRMMRKRIHVASLVVVLFVVVVATAAPWMAPQDPNEIDIPGRHQGPTPHRWLGTDDLGRDILSRLVYGARVSMQVGILAVGFGHGFGIALGLISGLRGGIVDEVVMRTMDALFTIPGTVLALAIATVLGPNVTNVIIAIAVTGIATPSRLVRGQVLAVREYDYVLAARSIGASGIRVAVRHIFPNILAPLIVSATLMVGWAILLESSLSFLGVGVQPPASSWGAMLQGGYIYLEINLIESFAPGLAIFFTILAINLLGDALREAWDPRLRGTG